MRFAALALIVAFGLPGAARAAEPTPYIFDVLPLQPYKGNLARLVKAKGVPDWVKSISSQGEGTAVPAKTVEVAGQPYRLDRVCKVHDCGGNTLDVLWAPNGHQVWAALVEGGKAPVMLGDPKPAQAKVLIEAATVVAPAAVPALPAPSTAAPAPAVPGAPPK